MVDWVILGFAIAFIAVGLGLFFMGGRPAAAGYRNVGNVYTGLLMGLAAALVVFSFFPTSAADGEVLGVTLTGAAAFAIIVWMLWVRYTRAALTQDEFEARLKERDDEAASLRRELETAKAKQRPQPLRQTERLIYKLDKSRKRIGLVTGDLAKVRFADIWVNTENTRMQMSRIDEPTISATVRYQGAEIDDFGAVVKDCIADELSGQMKGKLSVDPGRILVTGPGALARSHGVMRVFHAAAVQGEPRQGYEQVKNIERCVTEALEKAENVRRDDQPARSIIFPLMGAGVGGGDLESTSRRLLTAAIEYLTANPGSNLETVWFLAFTDAALACCQAALAATGRASELKR
jgi:O-acetyl-ADP-ribose deacetylase (regulator of RNase III)